LSLNYGYQKPQAVVKEENESDLDATLTIAKRIEKHA
jgi:hypothetical protein